VRNRLCFSMLVVLLALVLIAPDCRGDDASGRWKGRWTTYQPDNGRGHRGTLRVRLKRQSDGSYQGFFAGRFAVVIPYFYRAKVYQHGNVLHSTKQLGPFGNYDMRLYYQPGSLNGTWSAAGDTGSIRLRRL
jgi:hypothetical protein